MNARWAITRPVSIHRHSSVHKIVPRLASMSSITPYLYLQIFAGEISLRFNLNLQKFVQSCKIFNTCSSKSACFPTFSLLLVGTYSSEPWYCFTTSRFTYSQNHIIHNLARESYISSAKQRSTQRCAPMGRIHAVG